MENDKITEKIIGCCFKVHNELGPGFVERIYHNALKVELDKAKLNYNSEEDFSVFYDNERVGSFRCDFFIEGKVILEIKSVTGIMPILFQQQVVSYLKAASIETGLLINFGGKSVQVKRLANTKEVARKS